MRCICGSTRIMSVSAKCNDLCSVSLDDEGKEGYVPSGVNIGGGDYVQFDVCAQCGHMLGTWPLPERVQMIDEEDDIPELSDLSNVGMSMPACVAKMWTKDDAFRAKDYTFSLRDHIFQPSIANLGVFADASAPKLTVLPTTRYNAVDVRQSSLTAESLIPRSNRMVPIPQMTLIDTPQEGDIFAPRNVRKGTIGLMMSDIDMS